MIGRLNHMAMPSRVAVAGSGDEYVEKQPPTATLTTSPKPLKDSATQPGEMAEVAMVAVVCPISLTCDPSATAAGSNGCTLRASPLAAMGRARTP